MTVPSSSSRSLSAQRPRCAIGHIGAVPVSSIAVSAAFYAALGMRSVMVNDRMAILELRGGTHLILRQGTVVGDRVPFDLMVDDLDEVRDELALRGVEVGPVRRGGVHRSFDAVDPDGYRVPVTSSHVMGPV